MHSLATLRNRRSGLTLMELIVVLTILIALAGVMIPLLPSMLTRTQDATTATSISALTQMIQNYQQLYAGYPDQWDALGDTTQMIDYFAFGSGSPSGQGSLTAQVGGQLTSGSLTGPEVQALNAAGIYNVHPMISTYATGLTTTNWTPTFNPYSSPAVNNSGALNTGTPIAAGQTYAQLPGLLANQLLGQSPTGKYILLGIGQRNTMVGKVITEAPVVFADTPNLNPSLSYERFVAVFKVSDNGTALPNALFVSVLQLDDTGVMTANSVIQEYYQQN